jgi:citrate lyase subunit beta/citryl-CoA lyase
MTTLQQNTSNNWHSLLFIPADNNKFIASAGTRNADAIILDLEDSIPQSAKPAVREKLQKQIAILHKQSLDVVIRINYDLINAVADLAVAVGPYTKAIMVPKVIGADYLRLLDETISILEDQRDISLGSIKLIAQIESIEGLEAAKNIAKASPRLIGLAIGTEDLSLDGGFEPTPDNLILPAQKIIYAARLAKISAFGFPGSIADFSDIEQYSALQVQARAMGFNGALCIHPLQVKPINQAYTPSEKEVELAKRIITAYQNALDNNLGAVKVEGKMIDAPVVERALNILKSAKI